MAGGGKPGRRRIRGALLVAIVFLYALSVPWYRSGGAIPRIHLGIPDWVAAAIACYVAIAVLNSIAWLLTDIDEGEP
jgi:hypothetical protein